MPLSAKSARPVQIRNRYLFGSDLLLFASSTIIAFALRFEGFEWGDLQNHSALLYLLLSLPIKLYVFWAVGMYRRLWKYAGIVDVERLISAATASGFICLILGLVVLPGLGLTELRVPLSILFLDGLLTAAAASLPAVRRALRRPAGPAAAPQGWAASADRRGGRGRRDDRQGAAEPPAAWAQPDRLCGRRPVQAWSPHVRPAGLRLAVHDEGHRVAT